MGLWAHGCRSPPSARECSLFDHLPRPPDPRIDRPRFQPVELPPCSSAPSALGPNGGTGHRWLFAVTTCSEDL